MSKWQQVKLNDCCASISDGDHQAPPKSESGIPFVTISNIDCYNSLDFSNVMYVPQMYYDKLDNKRKAQKGDIIYSVVGSFGIPVLIKDNTPFVFQRHIAILKPNDTVDSRFLYYTMLSRDFYHKADAVAVGAAQRTISLTALRNLEISLPPIEIQRKIADVLSAYDDLIENNRKQIKLLEEAAQRLYKEWFIDLRFPGYESTPIIDGIPEGWEKRNLESIIGYEIGGGWGSDIPTNIEDQSGHVIRGTDINGITNGDILTVPFRYHAPNNLSSRILKHGDIIFEVSGGSRTEGVGKTLLITEQLLSRFNTSVICASFCKLIRVDNSDLPYYLAAALKYWRSIGRIGEFEKKSASSIINYRWKDFLTQQKILLPSTCVMKKYNDIAKAIYNKIISLSLMIEKTKQTRDRLLLKLMTGELEVK